MATDKERKAYAQSHKAAHKERAEARKAYEQSHKEARIAKQTQKKKFLGLF